MCIRDSSMTKTKPRSIASIFAGMLMLAAGLAAFAVPLHHAGPYGIPGRGLVGGLLCFATAAALFVSGTPKMMRGVVLVASPVVLFFALYGALAELEEVVVLYAEDADLRLWVVDHDGLEWVSMPRAKADTYAIDDHDKLSQLVAEAFSQRRKTLRNALRASATEEDLVAAGMDPRSRPERATIPNYVALANLIARRLR